MNIHQDQPRVPLPPDADRLFPVRRQSYRKAQGGQKFVEPFAIVTHVVRDEDAGRILSSLDAKDAAPQTGRSGGSRTRTAPYRYLKTKRRAGSRRSQDTG